MAYGLRVKPSIKTAWLEALRSGKYQQGQSSLRVDNNFCCLGVLCDISAAELEGYWIKHVCTNEQSFKVENEKSSAYLPDIVSEWAAENLDGHNTRFPVKWRQLTLKTQLKIKLHHQSGRNIPYIWKNRSVTLPELNDNVPPYSFELIADIIEDAL